jgi:tetratricopeptide (TPR) repeat protein
MSWNARRASIVLLPLIFACFAVWLEPGRAQVTKEKVKILPVPPVPPPAAAKGGPAPVAPPGGNIDPDGFLKNGIHLVKDEKGRGKQIEAAIDYINDENWATAVERLQKLLEIDEDVFVRLKRKNAEGREVYVWVSAKQEADRLLGSLPPAGMDFYKATYGAKAAELLKKAKQNGDPGLLNEIMKKYAHTDAGAEAIKLLGDYKFDRGEYMPALLCYSKLIHRLGTDKAPVTLLAKAAWAAHLAPPSVSSEQSYTVTAATVFSEKELWKLLRARTREVQFGEQVISVDDLQEYVAKRGRSRLEPNAAEPLLYRATPSRSNQLMGGPAFMTREWGVSLLDEARDSSSVLSAARDHLRRAKDALKTQNQPIIPAFSPIALSVLDRKGERIPLLIYKNFFGVTAVDLRNGALCWTSPSDWSLQRMLGQGDTKKSAVAGWLNYYQEQHPQILFENSTVSTLSTDGQFVYVVEDFAVPPSPQPNFHNGMIIPGGLQNNLHLSPELENAVAHNRLYAYSLAQNSGKLTWSLGTEEKDPLLDHYFLGPPLPLAGKLYLLADKQQEIRLICLDPSALAKDNRNIAGAIVSIQTLGMTQEKMQNDPLRRTWAAHLAYGEGILVCPTNAGAVFGVNLLENSLVWAYPYRDKNDVRELSPQEGMRRRMIRGGIIIEQPQTAGNSHNQWKVTAPIIADGKVVFTAPDAHSIHCINLRDGSPIWHFPKHEEDLYLGNIYNGKVLVVGKKSVRALSLSNGETLWTLETGTPSGQGIGSDNIYYLPLKDSGKGKEEPQIVGIDMDRGKIISRSKSRPSEPDKSDADVPGNLIFAEGKVVSVTPFGKGDHECEGEIVAYPQLKVKLAEMDDLIAKNPNDANALTERGELRLDKGDLAGAIDDLSSALKSNPSKETRNKARTKLYDTLTAYIADHFNEAEKYLKDYEELCSLDLDAAEGKERAKLEAEQRRRRATYLWLVGKGREEQGRLVEAFEKYQQFAQEAGKQSELVPAVDDQQVKAAPDVWSRGRILAMMNNATPENRRPLEKRIADKWDQLRQTNDLQELRAFVRMFGSLSEAGKEARLELAERLMEMKDSDTEHPLLEAELELNQFRTGRHRPELAARATEALARLYTRKGLLEDAASCYRKLVTEYATIVIRDGKTGRQIYDDDAATDKRLLPYLDDPLPLGSVRKFGVKTEKNSFPVPYDGQLFQFEQNGERLPFFRHHIIGLNLRDSCFVLLDRHLEDSRQLPREVWSQALPDKGFAEFIAQRQPQFQQPFIVGPGGMMVSNNHSPYIRLSYETVGHLLILPLGQRILGLDPVNHRLLWKYDLLQDASDSQTRGGAVGRPKPTSLMPDPQDNTQLLMTYNDGWVQRLGQISPFQGQTICIQTPKTLSALDPLTGRILWSRMDVLPRNYLFADEDYVFVVELDNQNTPNATRVFRAADGISVKAPDFAALFAKRLQVLGRYLLLAETGPTNSVEVRLYDMAAGQDVWKQKYPARSIVARSEDAGLTGIVEPDGKVHVIDLRARKEVMTGQLSEPTEQLKNVQSFYLLADRQYYYFASQTATPNGLPQLASAIWPNRGMREVPISGYLHAFSRRDGSYWNSRIDEPQHLLLEQFQDLPLVFLAARSLDPTAALGGLPPGVRIRGRGDNTNEVKVLSIHKGTGKLVCNEKLPANSTTNFFGIRIDPRTNTVELLSPQWKIIHYPITEDTKNAQPNAETSSRQSGQTLGPGPALLHPTLDRTRIRAISAPLPPG